MPTHRFVTLEDATLGVGLAVAHPVEALALSATSSARLRTIRARQTMQMTIWPAMTWSRQDKIGSAPYAPSRGQECSPERPSAGTRPRR